MIKTNFKQDLKLIIPKIKERKYVKKLRMLLRLVEDFRIMKTFEGSFKSVPNSQSLG